MPGLAPHLRAAVEVSGEHVIDPWSAPLAYLTQAMALGAVVLRSCELLSGRFDGDWQLETSQGSLRAMAVINAAGLFGDIVDERLGLGPDFVIKPRKGQFIVLDKAALRHVPKSSCLCRTRLPRASSSAPLPLATCWSARQPKNNPTAAARPPKPPRCTC